MRKFEKLTETAILPQRATPGSAGYDLYSRERVTIEPGQVKLVKTGVTAYMPENEVLLIHIRSSVSMKNSIMLANGVGVVDADYYPNEIGVLLYNAGDKDYEIGFGNKIAQGIFMEYLATSNDHPVQSERNGGFGSTDK